MFTDIKAKFEERVDFSDSLRDMCGIFLAAVPEGDPKIDEYLEAHQRALAALSRMTGEGE